MKRQHPRSARVRERTLGLRLKIANGLLILAMVVLGAVAISGLLSLGRGIDIAVGEYEEVQMLNTALVKVERVLIELREGAGDLDTIRTDLRGAQADMRTFADYQNLEEAGEAESDEADEAGHAENDMGNAAIVLHDLSAAMTALDSLAQHPTDLTSGSAQIAEVLRPTRDRLTAMAKETDLSTVRRKAAQRVRVSVLFVGGLSLLVIGAALVVSVRVHHQVVGSVRRLQAAVRKIASGRFTQRVAERGDREIVELARDFNRMAVELDTLYRVMESRIQEKSSELVRSERLASVGYLAAGVAHEISNPLSIIGGYATLARKWLSGPPTDDELRESCDALDAIETEAFRCKKIVEQLTTLSIAGSDAREPVSLKQIVRELISLVGGLERSRDRRVLLENSAETDDVRVMANPAELKQVVLNLIVNALGATESHRGEIRISITRSNGHALLTVADNGCGLGPEAIDKVFEPFFSLRNDADSKPGLGLGLTISHAIVEAHSGRLTARSEGLGKGSRFIVELPVADPVEADHV